MTNPNDLIRRGDALDAFEGKGLSFIRHTLNALPAAPDTPEVLALVEALDNLLEAITAENQFHDRSLTITGPTVNLKWLLEAEDEARAAIAAWEASRDR
jgi:hypothetical protein